MANAEEFILKLNQQISGPAAQANGALAQLEAQIRNEQRAIQGLDKQLASASDKMQEARQAAMAAGTPKEWDKAFAAVQKYKAAIAGLSEKSSERQGSLDKLIGGRGAAGQLDAMRASEKASKENSAAMKALERDSKKAAAEQKAAFDASASAAMTAAKVVLSLVTIVAGAVSAFVLFGLTAGDAARSVQLLNNAAAGGVIAGAELSAVVADIAGKVPLASAKLAEMARSLEMARLAGRNMQVTLSAMGTLAAAVGDGAAGKIQQIAESSMQARRFMLGARDIYGEFASLAGTGVKAADVYAALAGSMKVSIDQAKALLLSGRVSVAQGLEALDAAVQAKFGKTVAAQMLALTTQLSKLRENFSKLFEGVDLEPFLRGLKTVTELFSQTTVTGRAFKLLVTTLLQPLIDAATASFPIIRAFFQGLAIGALLVVVAVLQIRKAWRDAFGTETKSDIDFVKIALYAGIGAVGALVAMVALLTAAFLVLAVVTAPLWLPLLIGGALVLGMIVGLVYAFYKLGSFLGSIDLGASARNMVDSFVNALTIDNVVAAMTRLGEAAKGALKRALGIASPSKVAVDAAQNVTRSFSDTIDDGKGETRAAFNGMVEPGAGGGASSGAGRGPVDAHFHYHGGNSEDFDDFKQKCKEWFHGELSALLGEGPTPART